MDAARHCHEWRLSRTRAMIQVNAIGRKARSPCGKGRFSQSSLARLPLQPAAVRQAALPYFSLMQKCFLTGFSMVQVPLNVGSTTKASPGFIVTGLPPSGVMVIWPSIRWTNS